MSYEIRLHDLTKVYPDGTVALGGVSLVCPRSACTTLVGPSGSGKTTILKIISGLLDATSGDVSFDDRVVTGLPPEKRNIGMVFQSYALFPNMTVLENVEFGLLVRKVPPAERRRRAHEALESVQIAPLANRRIRQLSGGQQQRVALARAVVFQPGILLLDEPLSALDAKIRQELRGELAASLRQFKITAVYVTHDQEEAMALGDQVVVMDHGRIMQIGTPFEVYARPENEFVARFIGAANLYDVEIHPSLNAHFEVRLGFSVVSLREDEFRRRWPRIAGGPAQLMCRPQDVTIAEPSQAHARIRISNLLFLGDRIRVTGETENGKVMRFEAHNATRMSVGDVVPVRLDLDCIHILPIDRDPSQVPAREVIEAPRAWPRGARRRMKNVLFVCVHNSARSQMAEAFVKRFCAGHLAAHSAGIERGRLNPVAVEAMREEGLDISGTATKSVDDMLERAIAFDYVVTVCDQASAERCPVFPGGGQRLHWGFPDPSALAGTPEERLAETRKIRDAIKARVIDWCRTVCASGPARPGRSTGQADADPNLPLGSVAAPALETRDRS